MSPFQLKRLSPFQLKRLSELYASAASPAVHSANCSWYALYVKSTQERIVETWLERAGVTHFSPFVTRPLQRRRSNLERTEIPLLPGYVFARIDPTADVLFGGRHVPLVDLPGVVLIVGRGATPEAIPDCEVDSLRILCESRVSMASIPLVTAGDYVRVMRGPLAGAEGYVSWVKASSGNVVPRITISVTMLGRSVSAELDGDWLEKSNPVMVDGASSRATAAGRRSG